MTDNTSPATIGDFVAPVAPADASTKNTFNILDRYARVALSGIIEPGDKVAGELIAKLGAHRLYAHLGKRTPSAMLHDAAEDPGMALEASLEDVEEALRRWMPRMSDVTATIALKAAATFDMTVIIPGDEQWPTQLGDLGFAAPIALFCRGNADLLTTPGISLIGARAESNYGSHVALEASSALVDRGYTLISTGGYGIDAMVHRTALSASGNTIAILAGGIDRFYPSGNDSMLTRVIDSGLVVSELPPGSQPTKWRSMQRARLVAALSLATVVIEAGWRSGSLSVAGHAAALGRPVGAVPGQVNSPSSAGCHRLIRDHGATLVTNAEEMAWLAPLGETPAEDGDKIKA